MNPEKRQAILEGKANKLAKIMFDAVQKEVEHDDPELGINATILALCKLSASSLQFVSTHYGDNAVIDVFIESLMRGIAGANKIEEAADLAEDIIERLRKP